MLHVDVHVRGIWDNEDGGGEDAQLRVTAVPRSDFSSTFGSPCSYAGSDLLICPETDRTSSSLSGFQ